MNQALRAVAIFLEVAALTGILYCILSGVRLMAFDLGIGTKYSKPIMLFLAAAGTVVVIFFISHLSVFYPTYD